MSLSSLSLSLLDLAIGAFEVEIGVGCGGDQHGSWVVVEIDVRWLLRSTWVYSSCWDRLVAICFDVGRGEWWIWLLGCVYGVGGGDEVDWCWLLGCSFVG